jgi:two-component sensor histidine kinase/DNA-binding response OmpR family regulator
MALMTKAAQETQESGKTILLVEDNAVIALAQKMTLEKSGFSVVTAASGDNAVQAMKDNPAIDLVLMDIDLGRGIDGTETAEIILREREVPVVFLSSHAEQEVVEKTEKITSYGYIVKNSGPVVLVASIRMALRLFEARMSEKKHQASLETAYRELYETKHLLEQTSRLARVGGWETDVLTGEVQWSPVKREIHEVPADFQPDMPATIECYREGEDRETIEQLVRRAVELGEPYDVELRIVTAGGSERWVRTMGSAEFRGERCVRLYGTTQDIDERKRAETELHRQLEEKEMLLRETHHRIKNNMASVASLLALQTRSATNPEVTAALQDAAGRVNSMRELYEKMLRTEGSQEVAADGYVGDLVDSVVELFPSPPEVSVKKDLDHFLLGPRQLFSLGIIVNELLTNAIKHAFGSREAGTVAIVLRRHADRIELIVGDDGPGWPDDFSPDSSVGFGIMLVRMLSEQLEGTVSFESDHGARVVLQFPQAR